MPSTRVARSWASSTRRCDCCCCCSWTAVLLLHFSSIAGGPAASEYIPPCGLSNCRVACVQSGCVVASVPCRSPQQLWECVVGGTIVVSGEHEIRKKKT